MTDNAPAPQFDAVVFIGRFQPLHNAHCLVLEHAFAHTDHVIVLIGSANRPRSFKNPFDFEERRAVIDASITLSANQTLTCLPLDDVIYNDSLWLQKAQQAVNSVTQADDKLAIIGHDKDDSSYYLRLFPQWATLILPNFDNLSATPIRRAYFSQERIDSGNLPKASVALLQEFQDSEAYEAIQKELVYLQNYQAQFSTLPYPPIFQTADALVVQSGHILVVRRGGEYGRNLLALPGGFVDSEETLYNCAVRELQEETGLTLHNVSVKKQRTFDAPKRSARARTITTVFVWHLEGEMLPTLQAGDDANEAFWLPLGQLDGKLFFEDHYGIICALLGVS